MSESEHTLPHSTLFVGEWCDQRGIDSSLYGNLSWQGVKIATLRSQELSVAQRLRHEIELSLPLDGCELVDDPRLEPGSGGMRPKMYLAPEGMAFRLETTHEYEELDEWDEPIPGVPKKSVTRTIVGEYLGIETDVIHGEPRGLITVRERPTFYALPILNLGGGMIGANEDTLRLPSRYDPEKEGGYIFFSRYDGWDVVHSGGKLRGEYGSAKVQLVPFEKGAEAALYVADFGGREDYALDDFDFYDEQVALPPGFVRLPSPGGGIRILHNEVLKLVLPPIDEEEWVNLWVDHGIMIKFNPTVRERRFFYLDLDRRFGAEFQIRKLNTLQSEDKMFGRVVVVRNIGNMTVGGVVQTLSTQEKLSAEEYEKYVR